MLSRFTPAFLNFPRSKIKRSARALKRNAGPTVRNIAEVDFFPERSRIGEFFMHLGEVMKARNYRVMFAYFDSAVNRRIDMPRI